MKCPNCGYDNPFEAKSCNLCHTVFLMDPSSSETTTNTRQKRGVEHNPIKNNLNLIIVGLLLAAAVVFYAMNSGKYRDLEAQAFVITYEMYEEFAKNREIDRQGYETRIKELFNSYAGQSDRKTMQEVSDAINRGMRKAAGKFKKEYNIKCPYL